MRIAKYIRLILVLSITSSFSTYDDINIENLYQTWVVTNNEKGVTIYKSAPEFENDNFGIKFLRNGEFIIRQNSGFCATPITYENVRGKWAKESNSIIKLDYSFWGGKIYQDIKIIELTQSKLLTRLVSEYTPDIENNLIIEDN